jgi:hypothetical protein
LPGNTATSLAAAAAQLLQWGRPAQRRAADQGEDAMTKKNDTAKKTRKLTLDRTALRTLTADQLDQVNGAGGSMWGGRQTHLC